MPWETYTKHKIIEDTKIAKTLIVSCSWLYYHNNVLNVFTDCYMSKLIIKDNLTQYCSNNHTNCKYASLWYCCSCLTVIYKTNYEKVSLNSDGQQFHQYQPSK